jgi:hypothetical protein
MIRRWRHQESLHDLFELLPEEMQVADLLLHGRQLFPDQSEKAGPHSRARPVIKSRRQRFQILQGHPERTSTPDKQQSMPTVLGVLSIPSQRAIRGGQDTDLLVVTNRLGRHTRSLRELANLQYLGHRLTSPALVCCGR